MSLAATAITPNHRHAAVRSRPARLVVSNAEPIRIRTATVCKDGNGVRYFRFEHERALTVCLTRIKPGLIRTCGGRLTFEVIRAGDHFDKGHFEVTQSLRALLAFDFERCFQQMLGRSVAAISAGHLAEGDTIKLVMHDGFRERALRAFYDHDPDILKVE